MLMHELIENNLKGDLKDLFRDLYRLVDENFIKMCQYPNSLKFILPDTCELRSKFNIQKIKDSGIKELKIFDSEHSVGYVWFIQVKPGCIDLWVKIFGSNSPSKYKISLNGEGFVKSFYWDNRTEMKHLKSILEEFLNRLQFLKAVLLTD